MGSSEENILEDSIREDMEVFTVVQMMVNQTRTVCSIALVIICAAVDRYLVRNPRPRIGPNPLQRRMDVINRLVRQCDVICVDQLRVNRRCFMTLCHLINTTGLTNSRHVLLEEKVAIFLYILAHHEKNRRVKHNFFRSGQTVSRHFNDVLNAVLQLHGRLLKKPEPITESNSDGRWKYFQNCLGALDGTYIPVRAPAIDQARYRTRKGETAINVLGVCSPDMRFIYVLSGWEGSAADSRVLRDAVSRPNGLRIPTGNYYLVDAGYTNGQGFLAPYRGRRYHLSEWREGAAAPMNHEEFFNMKHASARNVIERCFGVLKMRWSILRSPSWFPIRTHGRIIMACFYIHNLIKQEMPSDPFDIDTDNNSMQGEQEQVDDSAQSEPEETDDDVIDTVETSTAWNAWRDNLAMQMYNEWRARRGLV